MSGQITSVITHFREAQYFENALKSLLNQTLLPDRIIVVDDFSNNGDEDKVDKIIKQYTKVPIDYIRRPSNGGLPQARNSAIDVCKTKYISFLDCDDSYYSHKLEKSVQVLEKYNEVFCAYSDFDILDEANGVTHDEFKFAYDLRLAVQTCIISTNSVFRMSVLKEFGGYDPNWRTTEDLEMYMRILSYYMAYHIPEKLFYYRLHAKQLTQVYRDKIIAETQELLKRGLVTKNEST